MAAEAALPVARDPAPARAVESPEFKVLPVQSRVRLRAWVEAEVQ
jgi:hypothetical protein